MNKVQVVKGPFEGTKLFHLYGKKARGFLQKFQPEFLTHESKTRIFLGCCGGVYEANGEKKAFGFNAGWSPQKKWKVDLVIGSSDQEKQIKTYVVTLDDLITKEIETNLGPCLNMATNE